MQHTGANVILTFCGVLQLCIAVVDWLGFCLDGLLMFALSPREQQIDDFFRQYAFYESQHSVVPLSPQQGIFGKALLQVQTVQLSRAQQFVIAPFHRPHHFSHSASLYNSSTYSIRSESKSRGIVVTWVSSKKTNMLLCLCINADKKHHSDHDNGYQWMQACKCGQFRAFLLLLVSVNLLPPLPLSSTWEQHRPAGSGWCRLCCDWLLAQAVLSPVEHVLVPPQIVPGIQS